MFTLIQQYLYQQLLYQSKSCLIHPIVKLGWKSFGVSRSIDNSWCVWICKLCFLHDANFWQRKIMKIEKSWTAGSSLLKAKLPLFNNLHGSRKASLDLDYFTMSLVRMPLYFASALVCQLVASGSQLMMLFFIFLQNRRTHANFQAILLRLSYSLINAMPHAMALVGTLIWFYLTVGSVFKFRAHNQDYRNSIIPPNLLLFHSIGY